MNINTVAVIGAGTMGHGLALVHALGGLTVHLHDTDEGALVRAKGLIDSGCQTLVDARLVTAEDSVAARDRIHPVTGLADAVNDTDLIVEAVVEQPDVKREVFAAIERHAPEHSIVASNTSYLDVFPLIPPAIQWRSLISHWYTPPYIIDLVDLVPGTETKSEIVQTVRDLYAGIGKHPLVFEKLIPGYIANRLQSALNLECFRMLDEGWVSAADIDYSIYHGLVLRLGVLGHMRKADFTGLHTVEDILSNRMYTPPEVTGRSETVSALVAEGRIGVTTGAGFYDYGDTPTATLLQERDRKLLALKQQLHEINEGGAND